MHYFSHQPLIENSAKPNKTNTYRPCCSAMFNNIFDVVEI